MASMAKAGSGLLALGRRDLISIAPMMAWTTRSYRYLVRSVSKRTRLYTEMYVADTIHYANERQVQALLEFEEAQRPLALQLGGSDPERMRQAMRRALPFEYDEYNLNCGCPSDKVAGKGCFGAALMLRPELVREVVGAMVDEAQQWASLTGKPMPEITVKCRLGADDMDTYDEFCNFIRIVAETGVRHFIVHARKCWLRGLDPKANRNVPPLRYAWVQRAALDFPRLRISVNGGVKSLRETDLFLGLRPTGKAKPAEATDDDTGSKCSEEEASSPGDEAAGGPATGTAIRTEAEKSALALAASQDSAGGRSGSALRQLARKGVTLSQNGMGPDEGPRWAVRADIRRLHGARKAWAEADSERRRAINEARAKEAEACRARGDEPPAPAAVGGGGGGGGGGGEAKEAEAGSAPGASADSIDPWQWRPGARLAPGEEPLRVPEPVPAEGDVPLWCDEERLREREARGRAGDAAAGGAPGGGSSGPGEGSAGAEGLAGGALIDSVMIGRQAFYNMWMLSDADRRFWGDDNPGLSRREAIRWYAQTYIVPTLRRAAVLRHGMSFESAFQQEREDAVLEAAQEEGYRVHAKATGIGGGGESGEEKEEALDGAEAPSAAADPASGAGAGGGEPAAKPAPRRGKKTNSQRKWLRRYGDNKVGCDCHNLLSPIHCLLYRVFGAGKLKSKLSALGNKWRDMDYRRIIAWLPVDAGAKLATGASSEGPFASTALDTLSGEEAGYSREDYPRFDPVSELDEIVSSLLPFQLDEKPPTSHDDLPPVGWEGDAPRVTIEMKAGLAAGKKRREATADPVEGEKAKMVA